MDGDNVIELNVGGQAMTTKRSTLCQVEGSLLSSMFSGRWDNSMSRDKDGRVFLDFNPTYFAFILDYLRAKKIPTAGKPATLPNIPSNQLNNYSKLIEYLGLGNEMLPKLTESFKEHSSEMKLENGGAVAAYFAKKISYCKSRQQFNAYVFGQNSYERGVIRLKLKVECPDLVGDIWVGMIRGDVIPELLKYYDSACRGWQISQYRRGQKVSYTGGLCSYLNSDECDKLEYTIELILDNEKSVLYLNGPDGNMDDLKLPEWTKWRLLVKLCGTAKLNTDFDIPETAAVVSRVRILDCQNILP